MADRDFNPQDGGYIRVMNEFVDKLISYRLDSSEWSIIMLVMRFSWGIRGRAWAEFSWQDIVSKTSWPNSTIGRAVKKLKRRNILQTAVGDERRMRYKINSKVSTWAAGPTTVNKTHSHQRELLPSTGVTPINGSYSHQRELTLPPTGVNTPTNGSGTLKDNIKDSIKNTPIVPTKPPPPKTNNNNYNQAAKSVIDFINRTAGKKFQYSDTSMAPILAVLKQGYSVDECLAVCRNKWLDPDLKEKYYRPVTLFRPSLFESYLNECGDNEKPRPTNDRHQRRLDKWRKRYEGATDAESKPQQTD